MSEKLFAGFVLLWLAGCGIPGGRPPDTPAGSSVTPSATSLQRPTRIPSRTPTITPTITLTPTVTSTRTAYEILEPETQAQFRESAVPIVDFFLQIQDAVRENDRAALAKMILYPISVYPQGQGKIQLRNENEFIAWYSQIATAKWKQTVMEQDAADLSINYQGVMIGRGEIWFGPICIGHGSCEKTQLLIIAIHPAFP